MLNFYRCKTPSSAFSKKFSATTLGVERNSYGDVAGWVAGCHTPVLYQNR